MIFRPLMRFDMWLLVRIFMPIAHWVDWRWHVNQYDLAARVMTAGLVLCVVQNVQDFVHHWGTGWVNIVAAIATLVIYSGCLRDLAKASKAYERRPDIVSFEAAMFILAGQALRMILLFLGALLMLVEAIGLHRIDLFTLSGSWMILVGMAWYFAGGLPPHRTRKKKKERKPWAALLSPPVRAS